MTTPTSRCTPQCHCVDCWRALDPLVCAVCKDPSIRTHHHCELMSFQHNDRCRGPTSGGRPQQPLTTPTMPAAEAAAPLRARTVAGPATSLPLYLPVYAPHTPPPPPTPHPRGTLRMCTTPCMVSINQNLHLQRPTAPTFGLRCPPPPNLGRMWVQTINVGHPPPELGLFQILVTWPSSLCE